MGSGAKNKRPCVIFSDVAPKKQQSAAERKRIRNEVNTRSSAKTRKGH
jgi:hypothetical protein